MWQVRCGKYHGRPAQAARTDAHDEHDVPSGYSLSTAISTSAPVSSAPTLGQESLMPRETRPWTGL